MNVLTAAVVTPKSPRTPTVGGTAVMIHSISHRFTMTFKMLTVCDLCSKQMIIGNTYSGHAIIHFDCDHDRKDLS